MITAEEMLAEFRRLTELDEVVLVFHDEATARAVGAEIAKAGWRRKVTIRVHPAVDVDQCIAFRPDAVLNPDLPLITFD